MEGQEGEGSTQLGRAPVQGRRTRPVRRQLLGEEGEEASGARVGRAARAAQSLLRGPYVFWVRWEATEGFSVKGGRQPIFLKGLGDSYTGGAWSDLGQPETPVRVPSAGWGPGRWGKQGAGLSAANRRRGRRGLEKHSTVIWLKQLDVGRKGQEFLETG